jgi:hypothetical protein
VLAGQWVGMQVRFSGYGRTTRPSLRSEVLCDRLHEAADEIEMAASAAFFIPAVDGFANSFQAGHDVFDRSDVLTRQQERAVLRYSRPRLAADASFAHRKHHVTRRFRVVVQAHDLRWPLSAFACVDLSAIREAALFFDQTPSGALFVADLGFVKAP